MRNTGKGIGTISKIDPQPDCTQLTCWTGVKTEFTDLSGFAPTDTSRWKSGQETNRFSSKICTGWPLVILSRKKPVLYPATKAWKRYGKQDGGQPGSAQGRPISTVPIMNRCSMRE